MSLDPTFVALQPVTLTGLVTNNDVSNSKLPWTCITAAIPGGGPGSALRASKFTFAPDPNPLGTKRTATLTVTPGSTREIDAVTKGSVVIVVQYDGNGCTEELTVSLLKNT